MEEEMRDDGGGGAHPFSKFLSPFEQRMAVVTGDGRRGGGQREATPLRMALSPFYGPSDTCFV